MKRVFFIFLTFSVFTGLFTKCNSPETKNNIILIPMSEKQITFSPKTHALDNNDNFSPDDRFLCYDTRGTVFNENLGNSKSIEKVEIATGKETILWEPESITGEKPAPGVAAVSYHPTEDKVIFIHGPLISEVEERGYYDIRNRTALEVDGEGHKISNKVDMRDIKNNKTTPGAHRGGTHRHEYSRNGNRIGFTYDDFLVQNIDRTIGFMQPDKNTPQGFTQYFCVILKPAEKGKSKPGEIEKAYGDSWVNEEGTMRAFIGKVRTDNGSDYNYDLFVADIPLDIDITSADPGTRNTYPLPPKDISIRRLTSGMNVNGIVRGSFDGKRIAFLAKDVKGTDQVWIINAEGSGNPALQVTYSEKNAEAVRWYPSDNWLFYLSAGNVYVSYIGKNLPFGKTIQLSDDDQTREQLVVSKDGKRLAYIIRIPTKNTNGEIVKDAGGLDFRQIFTMDIDWDKINE
jgi:hypothetical protein